MSSLPNIAVIGSLNADLVTTTSRVPSAGETLAAISHSINYGGKGANQASAIARLTHSKDDPNAATAKVFMVGAVGDDQFSKGMLEGLEADRCSTTGVKVLKGMKTGISTILVEEETGENRILYVEGANGALKDDETLVGADMDVVVFQLEIPMKTVCLPSAAMFLVSRAYRITGLAQHSRSKGARSPGRPSFSVVPLL